MFDSISKRRYRQKGRKSRPARGRVTDRARLERQLREQARRYEYDLLELASK